MQRQRQTREAIKIQRILNERSQKNENQKEQLKSAGKLKMRLSLGSTTFIEWSNKAKKGLEKKKSKQYNFL